MGPWSHKKSLRQRSHKTDNVYQAIKGLHSPHFTSQFQNPGQKCRVVWGRPDLVGDVRVGVEPKDLGNVLEWHVYDVIRVLFDRLEVGKRVAFVEFKSGLQQKKIAFCRRFGLHNKGEMSYITERVIWLVS